MMLRFLMALSARLPAREIFREGGKPYLERYYLGQLFGWTFYLHRFLAGDDGEDVHDHPWWLSWSLILSGRYWETRVRRIDGDGVKTRVRRYRPGMINVIRGTDFHRIDLPEGGEVWTLFAHGRRTRRWGFLRWFAEPEGLLIDYTLHPERTARELRWHETAPTGQQLRMEQRLRRWREWERQKESQLSDRAA